METTPAIDDARWLVGPDAAVWLREIAQTDLPLHAQLERLRKELSAERASLVIEQVELRRRAAVKFADAEKMYFTRTALEQATDEATAGYKARRFANHKHVADVCCGIGGDLIALAGQARATGVDRDPLIALYAQANLTAYQIRNGDVIVAEAGLDTLADCDAWHADPDRRPDGKRTTQVTLHSPGAETLDAMLHARPNAGIKLAPASEAPLEWQTKAEREWISTRGECRQQVAWFGGLTNKQGIKTATRLDAEGEVLGQFRSRGGAPASVAGELGECLYEPDPAVLAAKLTDDLALLHGLKRVAARIGYLTGSAGADERMLTEFRVLEVMPLRSKPIAACLQSLGVGSVEIKTRGVKLNPEQLRRDLKPQGERSAVLIAFPQGDRHVAVIAERA